MVGLPSGIATKLVTLGKYYAADGTLSTSWTATASVDRELRWVNTGDVIEQINIPVVKNSDGTASVRLPVTDQTGFVDAAGNPVTGWWYTITVTSSEFIRRPRVFQLPGAAADPFDADNVSVSVVAPTPPSSGSFVQTITVNGTVYSGTNITLPDAVSGAGTTTVDGIVDAKPIGHDLLLAADQAAAQNTLGLTATLQLVGQLQSLVTSMQNTIAAQATAIAALQSGKVDKTAIGVTVAGLDGAKRLLLVNLPTAVTVDNVADSSGVYPPRPATASRVIWYGPVRPTGGGSTNGGGGAVDNWDRWVVTP